MPDLEHSFSRRNLLRLGATLGLSSFLSDTLHANESPLTVAPAGIPASINEPGSQRLRIEKLNQWEALGYGMFIHFGMNTYDGEELSRGDKPASFYKPDKLDVNQWIGVARDAGMKYAILTTKHVPGFCLWPSRSEEHTSELQSPDHLVCRLLLEKKKNNAALQTTTTFLPLVRCEMKMTAIACDGNKHSVLCQVTEDVQHDLNLSVQGRSRLLQTF